MHVVVDSSVLVSTLIDIGGPIGRQYRARLVQLIGPDRGYVLRTLTKLEVVSALRSQLLLAELDPDGVAPITDHDCDRVVRGMAGWPFARVGLTQTMLNRIWELRNNITAYDAAYVAATEQLMADTGGDAVLATADGKLANAPTLSIPVELFSPS